MVLQVFSLDAVSFKTSSVLHLRGSMLRGGSGLRLQVQEDPPVLRFKGFLSAPGMNGWAGDGSLMGTW